MAIYTNAGGGGGLDPDGLTAAADDVLKGKTAGVQGSDEPVTGTLELTGSAGDSQVLSGSTYYNTDAKTKRTGTMTNQGAKTAALNCGGSYTIPAGYHNGAGKVTANSLASQTGGATAEDKYVYKGKTYWKDGTKRTGSMTVSSVVSFSLTATAYNSVTATWKWPSSGPYSGVAIQYKTGGYPTNAWDGTRGYTGTGSNLNLGASSSAAITGLTQGTTYYFRIWVYAACSAGDVYSGYREATATTKPRGQKTFTSSGTFTVPAGVTSIDVFCVGGGGGGTVDSDTSNCGGGGGSGGHTTTLKKIAPTPGTTYIVTVGAGGTRSNYGNYSYFYLGSTKLVEADGGNPGSYYHGGNGGSGGGGGLDHDSPCGAGGSNGSDGDGSHRGYGQGTTTRAFGEPSGTLYAGGGGGAPNGAGGSGGGGYACGMGSGAMAGSGGANTGGGGGGAQRSRSSSDTSWGTPGAGGSGIVIVRWGY